MFSFNTVNKSRGKWVTAYTYKRTNIHMNKGQSCVYYRVVLSVTNVDFKNII